MKTILLVFISAVFCAGGAEAGAEPRINDLLLQARQKNLDRHPTWLKLLSFPAAPRDGAASDIISPEFFNSSTGSTRPDLELEATLLAFYSDPADDPEQHALCRFPARYYWLDSMLGIPRTSLPRVSCANLEGWAKFERLDSVSLIMVSGYFGNPASTFGHILIKLNNSGRTESGDLLDQGVNFGAVVPDNEPTAIYIMKGLFGGYVGGFSGKKFYTQDLIYTETQFRDMWEYELNLNEFEKRMFVYHLWELVGAKYVYYFLKENCGYRVAKLLELATGRSFSTGQKPWFLPIDLFHALDEMNDTQHPELVKQVRFRPSSQRALYRDFADLDDDDALTVNALVEKPARLEQGVLDSFPQDRQAAMLDILLDYNNYKIAAYDDDDERSHALAAGKNSLLKRRLQLPAFAAQGQAPARTQHPPIPSPSSGSRPGLIHAGIGHHERFGTTLNLGFAAIHYDRVGNVKGSLENSEMKVFDVSIGLNQDEGAFLDHLNVISIQKLDLNHTRIFGESSLSWRIKAGARRKDFSCLDCPVVYMSGGPGRAYRLGRSLVMYGMLDMTLQSKRDYLALSPTLGFIGKRSDRWKALVELEQRIDNSNRDGRTLINIESRYSVAANDEIRVCYDRFVDAEYRVSWYRFW